MSKIAVHKNKGRKRAPFSVETRRKMSEARRGMVLSLETRRRMSVAKKGKCPRNLKQIQEKARILNTGRKLSEEHKQKIADSHRAEKSYRWIVDRSKLSRTSKQGERRTSAYFFWRKQVWLRDKFACKIGNPDCEGRIEAHHILGWSEHPELRYEVNNGITLCHAHHPRRRAEEKRLIPTFMELVTVSNESFCLNSLK